MKKKILSLVLAVSLMAGALAGCSGAPAEKAPEVKTETEAEAADASDETQQTEAGAITVVDQIGREVTLEKPAKKLVSSYYISTAIAIALGLEDQLVGIEMKADTRELYKKAAPQLLELPAVGSGKGINVEETAALTPDVVIIPKKLQDSVTQFEALNIPVLVVNPETLEDYMACVELLGAVTGTEARAEELNTYYETKIAEISALTADLEEKPAVYLAAGSNYYSTCTSQMYQNDLIAIAGGTNVSAELSDSYWAEISPEQLLTWNPEYIFAVSYAEYSLSDILDDEKLAQVQAVAEGQVKTFPSTIEAWDYPTPSSVLGILWLAQELHPDLYARDTYIQEAKDYYEHFFGIEVTEAELGLE